MGMEDIVKKVGEKVGSKALEVYKDWSKIADELFNNNDFMTRNELDEFIKKYYNPERVSSEMPIFDSEFFTWSDILKVFGTKGQIKKTDFLFKLPSIVAHKTKNVAGDLVL